MKEITLAIACTALIFGVSAFLLHYIGDDLGITAVLAYVPDTEESRQVIREALSAGQIPSCADFSSPALNEPVMATTCSLGR